jgi:hypothetical protein
MTVICLLRNKMEGRWHHHRPGCLPFSRFTGRISTKVPPIFYVLVSKMIYPFDDLFFIIYLDMKTLAKLHAFTVKNKCFRKTMKKYIRSTLNVCHTTGPQSWQYTFKTLCDVTDNVYKIMPENMPGRSRSAILALHVY